VGGGATAAVLLAGADPLGALLAFGLSGWVLVAGAFSGGAGFSIVGGIGGPSCLSCCPSLSDKQAPIDPTTRHWQH